MSDEDGLGSMTPTPPSARRRSMVPLLVLILLAFVVRVGVTIWAWPQIQSRMDEPQPQAASMAAPQASTVPRTLTQRSLSIDAAQMLDARVVQLEERLTRITVEAQAASGNAARAEGLLVAFAIFLAATALFSITPVIQNRLIRMTEGAPVALALNGSVISVGQALGSALGGAALAGFGVPAIPAAALVMSLTGLTILVFVFPKARAGS